MSETMSPQPLESGDAMHQLDKMATIGVEEQYAIRFSIEACQQAMILMPQVLMKPEHHFAEKLYARHLLIKKGTILTGKVHRQDDLQIMIYGDISVLNDMFGYNRMTGYNIFTSKAGTSQIGIAHEDTLWVTVHYCPLKDLEEIEEFLYFDGPKVLDYATGEPLHDNNASRSDYSDMLKEMGIDDQEVWAQSCIESDRLNIELPVVTISNSSIHGFGIFANQNIDNNSVIGPSRIFGLRTQLGRYTNHSINPNAEMVECGDDIVLIATKSIKKNQEITTNYRITRSLNNVKHTGAK